MNNAPFKIGQKVVCIDDSRSFGMPHAFIKGEEYVVTDIHWFALTPREPWGVKIVGYPYWYNASRFAPIETNYSDATNEIPEKFPLTEGGQVDKVITPEKIKI